MQKAAKNWWYYIIYTDRQNIWEECQFNLLSFSREHTLQGHIDSTMLPALQSI